MRRRRAKPSPTFLTEQDRKRQRREGILIIGLIAIVALMTFAEELARSEACDAMRLTSAMFRQGAHAFYERIGFTRPGYVFKKEMAPAPRD